MIAEADTLLTGLSGLVLLILLVWVLVHFFRK